MVIKGCDPIARMARNFRPCRRVPQVWTDPTPLRVLGMGTALPGVPIGTDELLDLVEARFDLSLRGCGVTIARKLGIQFRHVCRPFDHPLEGTRPGQRNPELAAQAVRDALEEAGLAASDLGCLIGHTATPANALPANVARVAAELGYHGPFAEFRQACAGFANALVFALCLLRAGSGPVMVVGSETGSVHFDARRAATDPGQLVNLLQMGDAAAAIVLACDDGRPGARLSRVFHGQLGPGCRARGGWANCVSSSIGKAMLLPLAAGRSHDQANRKAA